jgi:CheY-like chemotaxis protein
MIENNPQIDLLFTDLVMPGGMSGKQLADRVAAKNPSIRVLFTSGYAEEAVTHHERLTPGVLMLGKPYRKADLARMVRQALAQDA